MVVIIVMIKVDIIMGKMVIVQGIIDHIVADRIESVINIMTQDEIKEIDDK